jgi:dihydrofolate synthase/folylpolyglutamate synthase
LRALEAAGVAIDENVVAMAMGSLTLNGRRECQRLGNIELVLDVAHNPDAAMELRNFLDLRALEQRTIAIFAVMSDKDWRDMIAAVEDVIDEWYLPAGIGGSRGQSPEVLAGFISTPVHVGSTFEAAFEGALGSLGCGGRLIIFGSFFTVGEGMKALECMRLSRLSGQS